MVRTQFSKRQFETRIVPSTGAGGPCLKELQNEGQSRGDACRNGNDPALSLSGKTPRVVSPGHPLGSGQFPPASLDFVGTKREHWHVSAAPETSMPAAGDLETAVDQAIAACGADAREAVRALIVANNFLKARVTRLQASVSTG